MQGLDLSASVGKSHRRRLCGKVVCMGGAGNHRATEMVPLRVLGCAEADPFGATRGEGN